MNFNYDLEESKESKLERKLKKERLERVRRERERAAEQQLCGEATGHHYRYDAILTMERICSICGYYNELRLRPRRAEARAESPQATSES